MYLRPLGDVFMNKEELAKKIEGLPIVDQQWLLSYLIRLLRPQLQGVMLIQDPRQIYDDWDDEEVDKLYQDLYESLQSK